METNDENINFLNFIINKRLIIKPQTDLKIRSILLKQNTTDSTNNLKFNKINHKKFNFISIVADSKKLEEENVKENSDLSSKSDEEICDISFLVSNFSKLKINDIIRKKIENDVVYYFFYELDNEEFASSNRCFGQLTGGLYNGEPKLAKVIKAKQGQTCSKCNASGRNLWLCLDRYCLVSGCSERANDHSTEHFKLNNQHCVHINLSSQRIWCYLCEIEVFYSQRRNSLVTNNDTPNEVNRFSERFYERNNSHNIGDTPESSGDEDDDIPCMDGLVGLQNIANTCYMNAALQALSNSPPLTYYFLDCGDIIDANDTIGNNRKPGLAKSYHSLMKEMWFRSKKNTSNFVIPRGILYGIRSVYPMFRGYQQHDTQEFLRCFMDQLHEELKEVIPPPPDLTNKSIYMSLEDRSLGCGSSSTMDEDQISCSSPSQSEAEEYETCDSGVSEQSSLSDEGTLNLNNRSISATKQLFGSRPSSPASSSALFMPYSVVGKVSPQHKQPIQSGGDQKQNTVSSPSKSPHRSIISDVFDGKLLSSVQCLTCNRISTREETFQDLSLPIPGKDHLAVLHQSMMPQHLQQVPISSTVNLNQGSTITCTDAVYQAGQDGWLWWVWNWLRSWFWGPSISLHDCMAAFFSADELKGDNMYSCEQCNKLRNGIKYSRVLALPEMLCIHLKRFRHDLSYSSKISSAVVFPLTGLDMRPHLHKDCTSEISSYDLTAVICHHGTVGGGHYTSFAKHELTEKWYEFDDQIVNEVTPEVVQNCQAYVLFYRKTNANMTVIRAQAQELAKLNPPQASDIRFFVSRNWINRFNTFAEPGPIDNWTILCPHGGLPPCKAALMERLATPLPQTVWDFLYKKFGGGPACNRLFECETCRRSAELLSRRQESELEAFTKYNSEYQEKPVTTLYAISMAWFRKWQAFARGLTNEEPGPISNSAIAAISETSSMPIRNVKPGSDCAHLNKTLWKFFHGIYGGGPEIRGSISEDLKLQKEKEESMEMEYEQKYSNSTISANKPKDIVIKEKCESSVYTQNNEKIIENNSNNNSNINVNTNDEFDNINNTFNRNQSILKSISKQIKNVSFEDDTEELVSINCVDPNNIRTTLKYNDEENKIANNSHLISSGGGRRGKYEFNNKKDKKYRSAMKTTNSTMFGPEGKYQTQSSLDNSIPESVIDNSKNNNFDLINQYVNLEHNPPYPIIPINNNNPNSHLQQPRNLNQESLHITNSLLIGTDIYLSSTTTNTTTTTVTSTQQKVLTTTLPTIPVAIKNSISMKRPLRDLSLEEIEPFILEDQQRIQNQHFQQGIPQQIEKIYHKQGPESQEMKQPSNTTIVLSPHHSRNYPEINAINFHHLATKSDKDYQQQNISSKTIDLESLVNVLNVNNGEQQFQLTNDDNNNTKNEFNNIIKNDNNNNNNNNNNINTNNINNNNNNINKTSILSKKFPTGSVGKGHHHRKKLKPKNKKNNFSKSTLDNGSDSC